MSDVQLISTPGVFGETGNFLLERELGHGGMGGVYMGRDKMLDRPVAVKVMLPEYGADAEFVEKFKREAQAAARLIHPNIAQVYSYGIADGMPYIAMELVAGGSLWTVMTNAPGSADVTRVLKIGEQVAQALRCAADQGVVHGDIKPENILLDANGNAKIVDFGLAAMQKDTEEIWGTPYYIAPEKIKREQVDFRADMYNLGATLYHALTGVAPFEGADAGEVVKARFIGPPKKPSEIRAGLTPAIDALIMKMIALEKEARYPSFEALLLEFRKVLTTGLTASKKPTLKIRRAVETAPKEEAEEEGGDGEDPALAAKRRRNSRLKKVKGGRMRGRIENADAEDSDTAGSKFGLVIAGVVGAVVLVIGGLVWYKLAADHEKEVKIQQAIERGVNNARSALNDTRKAAVKYGDSLREISTKVRAACEKATADLVKVVPPEVGDRLKLPPTQDLLDAIASTNTVAEAETKKGKAEGDEKAKAGGDEAAPKPARRAARPVAAAAKPARVLEEYDPDDPDAKPIEQVKAEADAADAAKAAQEAKEAEEAAKAAGEEPPPPVVNDPIIKDINELWERAYACEAGTIRICAKIDALVADIDAALKTTEMTEAAGKKLGDLSVDFLARFNEIKGTPESDRIFKANDFITKRGARVLKQKLEAIRVAKLQEEREEKKRREAELEAQRQKERAEAHAKLVAKEEAEAKAKYQSLIEAGTLRLLSWEPALLQISNQIELAETAEGKIAYGKEKKKVQALKAVQEILVTNVVNYTFARSTLKGSKVLSADMHDIKILKADGKTRQTLLWTKIYTDYHGNLNEIINRFIVRGRQNAGLNKIDWCEAVLGVALTYRVLYSEDPAAMVRGEQLAKKAVAEFPDYKSVGEYFFPDLNFDDEGGGVGGESDDL